MKNKKREAFKELEKDIFNACSYAYDFHEIDFSELDRYRSDVKKELEQKCDMLKNLL